MKNKFKRFCVFATALCLALSCTVTSFAAVSHLTFVKNGSEFRFNAKYNDKRTDENSGNTIFASFSDKAFIPGEVRNDEVKITNNTDMKTTFVLKVSFDGSSIDNGNAKDLANKMLLKLETSDENGNTISQLKRNDGSVGVWIGDLNGGNALGANGKKSGSVLVTLGKFDPGETRTVKATVEYVGERATDEDLGTEIHTKWQIGANPDVPNTPSPGDKDTEPDKKPDKKPDEKEPEKKPEVKPEVPPATPDPEKPPLPPPLKPDDIPRYRGDSDRDEIEVVYLDPDDEEFIIFDDETPLADLPLTGGKMGIYFLIAGIAAIGYGSYSLVKIGKNKD